jgi:hypothetical protein
MGRYNAEPEKSDDRNGAKGAPLGEFVPSEKIEANQAVDCPSDIKVVPKFYLTHP